MREIKFRAWDKEKKIMVTDFDQYAAEAWGLKCGYDINRMVRSVGLKYETLAQYTGLKDKNGVEIYEGDIISPKVYKFTRFGNCEVEFSKGMFCLSVNPPFITKRKPLYKSIYMGENEGNEFEVVGNIHENPELLEAK